MSVSLSFYLLWSFFEPDYVSAVLFVSCVSLAHFPLFSVSPPFPCLFSSSQFPDSYVLFFSGSPQMHTHPPPLLCAHGKAGVQQPSCIWAALELNEGLRDQNGGCRSSLPTRGPRTQHYRNPAAEASGLPSQCCVRMRIPHLPRVLTVVS